MNRDKKNNGAMFTGTTLASRFTDKGKQHEKPVRKRVATDREKRAALVEMMQVTGAMDRVNELISSCYLVQSFANSFMDECEELLKFCGIKKGTLELLFDRAQKANECFFDEFFGIVNESTPEEIKLRKEMLFKDFDRIRTAYFNEFKEKEEEWEINIDRDKIREIADKYGVEIRFKDGEDY